MRGAVLALCFLRGETRTRGSGRALLSDTDTVPGTCTNHVRENKCVDQLPQTDPPGGQCQWTKEVFEDHYPSCTLAFDSERQWEQRQYKECMDDGSYPPPNHAANINGTPAQRSLFSLRSSREDCF